MKKNRILALMLIFAMTVCLAACGGGSKPSAKETVTVSFDTDGGDAVEAQTIEKGSAALKPATPKKAGYIFDKWTLNGNEYEFGSAVNENITLKAVWVDPNSGSGGSEPEVKCEDLYWVNNWYWVQVKCYGDPEYVVKPENLKDKITFTSSDTSIATVDEQGVVYGVKAGNVTITMKCGDKTAELPLEVRGPRISLDTDHLVMSYHNNEVSNALHPLTVSFEYGANPSSKVTWTSSNPKVAGVSDAGVVGAVDLGHTVITATTEEGYKASCDVYVTGTALRVYYKGTLMQNGNMTFNRDYTYELSLVEEHYYDNGFSKEVPVSHQCNLIGPSGIYFYVNDEYSGIMYFSTEYISSGKDYRIQFCDPLNNVYSDLMWIHIE